MGAQEDFDLLNAMEAAVAKSGTKPTIGADEQGNVYVVGPNGQRMPAPPPPGPPPPGPGPVVRPAPAPRPAPVPPVAPPSPVAPVVQPQPVAPPPQAPQPGVSPNAWASDIVQGQDVQRRDAEYQGSGYLDSQLTPWDLRDAAAGSPPFETPAQPTQQPFSGVDSFGRTQPLIGLSAPDQQMDLNKYQNDELARIRLVGAQNVKLDPRIAQGAAQQQGSLEQLKQYYAGMEPRLQAAEAKYQQESDRYRTGLGELDKKRVAMQQARGVEQGIEAQQLASSEMRFDANRVYADLAQSPMQTGALALAAGIVQGLQGYAGQDKPNAIIAAVQEAAQRDVTNQLEQAKRGQAAREGSRNSFMEARQMLQDDEQALQVAAMASLNQIAKGMDFLKGRMLRAKDRSDIDTAIGKIMIDIGKAQTDLSEKNADRQLRAAISNQGVESEIAKARISTATALQKMSFEQRQKAAEAVRTFSLSEPGTALTKSIDSISRFYGLLDKYTKAGMKPDELRGLIEKDTLTAIKSAVQAAANKPATGPGSAIANAFMESLSNEMAKATFSPEKREMQQAVQEILLSFARSEAGKSRTASEMQGILQTADLGSADSVYRFVGNLIGDARSVYNQQVNLDKTAKPAWDEAYGLAINEASIRNNNVVNAFENARQLQGQ